MENVVILLEDNQAQDLLLNSEGIKVIVNGVSSTIHRTILRDIYKISNGSCEFLYNANEHKIMGRKHNKIYDFTKSEKDGESCYCAKVIDVITVDNEDAPSAELSYLIDESGNKISPAHCSLDPHKKFITGNDDQLVALIRVRLLEELSKDKEDEAMQLKLSHIHKAN